MNRFLKILAAIAIVLVISTLALVVYDYYRTRQAFPPNTFIGPVDISLLSKDQALVLLKKFSPSRLFTPLITLEADPRSYSFSPEKLGVYIFYEKTINKAFALTHKPNYFLELKHRVTNGKSYAPIILGVEESRLRAILEALAEETRSASKDAMVVFYEETGGYHIVPDVPYKTLNIEKSIAAFAADLVKGRKAIRLVFNFTDARIKEKDLRANPPVYRVSAYTTYYGTHDSPNRIHNIKLIASWLDGKVVLSGEAFSLSDSIGEFTPERGFKEAFVILGNELVPELGGGTCQIGTTLYNVLTLADLKITQRRNHSFYFNIYPLGRDATVYPGSADLKFENDSGYPIMIKVLATSKKLSFRIYGTPSYKKVVFSSPKVRGRSETGEFVPMSLKQVIALDVPFKTEVVRTVYDKDGKKIKEETVKSYYKLYGDKDNVPIKRPEPR